MCSSNPSTSPAASALPNDVSPSSEQHVLSASGAPRLLERGPDPLGDEDEGRASVHLQGLSGMVGERAGK